MSNLYIRVRTGFYTHKKTAKLQSIIGNDAFWIPPRLWAYAAENQPDGNFSTYSSEQLAMLLGCYKDATRMLQALIDSGFIDPDGMIHDWAEHNGYHETFAKRAAVAAAARWAKKKKNQEKEDTGKRKEETSIASRMLQAYSKDAESMKRIEKTWEEWIEHRRQKRASVTESIAKKQIELLESFGVDRAIAALNHSMLNGWTGIFEPKDGGQAVKPKRIGPNI